MVIKPVVAEAAYDVPLNAVKTDGRGGLPGDSRALIEAYMQRRSHRKMTEGVPQASPPAGSDGAGSASAA